MCVAWPASDIEVRNVEDFEVDIGLSVTSAVIKLARREGVLRRVTSRAPAGDGDGLVSQKQHGGPLAPALPRAQRAHAERVEQVHARAPLPAPHAITARARRHEGK